MQEINEFFRFLEIYLHVLIIFSFLCGLFWLWMLIDCIVKETNEGNERFMWVVIIILTNFLGALLYFFMRWARRIPPSVNKNEIENTVKRQKETSDVFAAAYKSCMHEDLREVRIVSGVPLEVFYSGPVSGEFSVKFYSLQSLSEIQTLLKHNIYSACGRKNAMVAFYKGKLDKGDSPKQEVERVSLNNRELLRTNFDKGVWFLSQQDATLVRLI